MKSEVDIANEVIDGKWGIGKDREKRIRAAGYDYNAVQALVNQMITTGKKVVEIVLDPKECCGYVIRFKE